MSKKKTSTKSARKSASPTQVHTLKIALKGSAPPIWRKVAVPSNYTLGDLHIVIQIVMGWSGGHLHQFIWRAPKTKPTPKGLPRDVQRIMSGLAQLGQDPDRYISDPAFELEETENENKITLSQLAPEVKNKFIYEYDFGDSWEHEITVLEIGSPQEGVRYPTCLDGKLACPPDDCGGLWGYYELQEILKDKNHPEHEERLEWLGDDFDPEKFDIQAVNKDLAKFTG